jgi:hypothetical protein
MMSKLKWTPPFQKKWYGKPQPKPDAMMKVTVNTQCTKCERKNGRRSIVVKKNISKKDFVEKYSKIGAVLSLKCRYCNGNLKMVE